MAIEMIGSDGDKCMVVIQGSYRFYVKRRDIQTNIELVQTPDGMLPLNKLVLAVAWLDAQTRLKDVQVSGQYIAYTEEPPFWEKRAQ